MAEETPNNSDINNTDSEFGNDENPNSNPKSSSNNVLAVNGIPSSPLVCLVNFAFDAASGAATGSVFGYGFGLWKNKGFKGSFADAAATAKTFAVMSGINSFVLCLLRRLRGKDDVINAGLAGCCTGLAISYPGPPVDLLKSCIMFASFGVMTEGLNKKQSALAQSNNSRESRSCPTAILPLAFPLSDELKGPFLSFCQSLSKSKKRNHPSAA